jgi:CelD/BcsL family acetyltransferase involved in cellulose biosynthesis
MTISVGGDSATTASRLTFRVLHSFEDAQSLRQAWNDLVLRCGADVYQTFDWCQIWWRHYGAGRQLHLLLCFCSEELIGVVPAFVETLWLGPVRLRVAKLVGADFSLHLCNLPVAADAFSAAVSNTIRHFLGNHHCDLLLIGPLSGTGARLDELLAVGQQESALVGKTETLGTSCNTYFDLPSTFSEYEKAIGKQQRGNLNRTVAQLSKAHRVSFDVVSDPAQLAATFEDFCALHKAQWQAEGKLGHFGDWPGSEDYNRDLVRTLGAQGMVRFHRILADDRVVSLQYGYVLGGTNYWRLPARAFAPEWDRLSFGRMGLAKMIGASINEGLRTIEGGRGHYDYKLQMGGNELPLRTVQFMRRGPGVSARIRVFKTLATMLDLAYYKVLFARIAPRMPALQHSLWPVWIRSTW